ncbi:hypothetical protein PRIPAC_95393 [Pristionchus pacificus]|uniref:Uncharacterized protein n=1 Tax=Pristionchus pacificus TaxID=54126 RepID=A0A2A6D1E2_PRIPA|nr:hypothetical protein PRIPAC_95393 [Pristionchus pacificus]|eukprot:PDM84200.1 hypothetical protein PRIPAC_33223 [Pristionchus pacificus]
MERTNLSEAPTLSLHSLRNDGNAVIGIPTLHTACDDDRRDDQPSAHPQFQWRNEVGAGTINRRPGTGNQPVVGNMTGSTRRRNASENTLQPALPSPISVSSGTKKAPMAREAAAFVDVHSHSIPGAIHHKMLLRGSTILLNCALTALFVLFIGLIVVFLNYVKEIAKDPRRESVNLTTLNYAASRMILKCEPAARKDEMNGGGYCECEQMLNDRERSGTNERPADAREPLNYAREAKNERSVITYIEEEQMS